MGDHKRGLGTLAVHAGTDERQPHGAITVPVIASSTYVFDDTDELKRHMRGEVERMEYGRYGNPTVRAAEMKIAGLEGAEDALLFASGMAAITTTLLTMLRSGQHMILTDECYRRTRQFCLQVLSKMGVVTTVVPTGDIAAMEAAIRSSTRVIFTESPTNPKLNVVDVAAIKALKTKGRYFKVLIDSTFATPINQQPLTQGADLVIHSGTKYLAGHNDILCGAVAGSQPLIDALRQMLGVLGGVMDPHGAYLLIRGLKTLPLRVRQQNATAQRLAEVLDAHPKVATVYYPGLPHHPGAELARATMGGFGGVVSFELDTDLDGTSRFIDACRIFKIGPSLGGVESLIEQVALMSFFELTTEQRGELGISNSLVRMAVGIEDVEDLEAALLAGLAAI